jgi:hypothetical protein
MPKFMADFTDKPVRRRFQPPYETAERHGLEPDMTVLEVGPGNGTYAVGAAQRIGASSRLVTTDIEPSLIERVKRRAAADGLGNVTFWTLTIPWQGQWSAGRHRLDFSWRPRWVAFVTTR